LGTIKESAVKKILFCMLLVLFLTHPSAAGISAADVYPVGTLKPIDSRVKVRVGDVAPDFKLPTFGNETVTLSRYRGRKNVLLSFVPAAWTPVCSDQWPGYNLLKEEFAALDTVLLGISVDNIPTLYAWTQEMGGLWFPVLSDFWPHGRVAETYGILRSDGTAERAIIIIDKTGVIRYLDVHDINARPRLEPIMTMLKKLP